MISEKLQSEKKKKKKKKLSGFSWSSCFVDLLLRSKPLGLFPPLSVCQSCCQLLQERCTPCQTFANILRMQEFGAVSVQTAHHQAHVLWQLCVPVPIQTNLCARAILYSCSIQNEELSIHLHINSGIPAMLCTCVSKLTTVMNKYPSTILRDGSWSWSLLFFNLS